MRFASCCATFFRLLLTTAAVFLPLSAQLASAEVPPETLSRLRQFLPRALSKLAKRSTLRVVVLGDSVSQGATQPGGGRALDSTWHFQFLRQLGDHFYYTGGVRDGIAREGASSGELPEFDLKKLPPRGELPRLGVEISGPKIRVLTHAREGACAVQALQSLTTDAFDENPDLVLLQYGSFDALAGNPLPAFQESLQAAVKLCREHRADIMIAGPPLILAGDFRASLPITRSYSAAARSVAVAENILFVDFGEALGKISFSAPAENPEAAMTRYVKGLAEFYLAGEVVDAVMPNAKGQALLAAAAWKALSAPPVRDPYQPSGSLVLPTDPNGAAIVEVTLRQPDPPTAPPGQKDIPAAAPAPKNNEPQPSSPAAPAHNAAETPPASAMVSDLAISLLPVAQIWGPPAGADLSIKEFAKRRSLRLPFSRLPQTETRQWSGLEATPVFVLHGPKESRLFDVTGPVLPVAMEISPGRKEGVAGDLILDCIVKNTETQPFAGTAQISWLGKTFDLDFVVDAASEKILPLRLAMPSDPSLAQISGPLTVQLKSGERTLTYGRTIQALHHLPLAQRTPLVNQATAESSPGSPAVLAKADAQGLYLTLDLPPAQASKSALYPSAQIQVMVDARGPAQQGQNGFIDAIHLDLPWADGPLLIKRVKPAVFGDGYDRELNLAAFRAVLRTEASGKRVVQIDLPRNYLYLHQWSLQDSGQNSLGFNVGISFLTFDAQHPEGWFSPESAWALARSQFPRQDTRSLGVLELRTQPTGEWSVLIF